MNFKKVKKIKTPLSKDLAKNFRIGDWILLSGIVYTARDQAHKRMFELIEKGKKMPLNLENAVIYYTGPSPAKPGGILGSAGPTTSARMDKYTPLLLKMGLSGMIGKGERSGEVKSAVKEFGGVYLVTIGGAGAYLSERVKKVKCLFWQDLGPEAIYEFILEDFPCLVAYDAYGGDYFQAVRAKFRGGIK